MEIKVHGSSAVEKDEIYSRKDGASPSFKEMSEEEINEMPEQERKEMEKLKQEFESFENDTLEADTIFKSL